MVVNTPYVRSDAEFERINADYLKEKEHASHLRSFLKDLLDWLESSLLILRFILYVGSVLMAWFYLRDRALAVGIILSLTVAHLLMAASEKVEKKQVELANRRRP